MFIDGNRQKTCAVRRSGTHWSVIHREVFRSSERRLRCHGVRAINISILRSEELC